MSCLTCMTYSLTYYNIFFPTFKAHLPPITPITVYLTQMPSGFTDVPIFLPRRRWSFLMNDLTSALLIMELATPPVFAWPEYPPAHFLPHPHEQGPRWTMWICVLHIIWNVSSFISVLNADLPDLMHDNAEKLSDAITAFCISFSFIRCNASSIAKSSVVYTDRWSDTPFF